MCTLTYIPMARGACLTHNRDEHRMRGPALPPQDHIHFGKTLRYPKDTEAGGTWYAMGRNWTLALLNGAGQRHERNPPYRRSRGLVLLDFFEKEDPRDFCGTYDFQGIEPFTLILLKNASGGALEFSWDGTFKKLLALPREPFIRSSITLYDGSVRAMRQKAFEAYLRSDPAPTPARMLAFHRGEPSVPGRDLILNRPDGLRTQSLTQVLTAERHMEYIELSH